MPLTPQLIDEVVTRYLREREHHENLARRVAGICRELMRRNVIRGGVQFRSKHPEHLRRKLVQLARRPEERDALDTVEDVFRRLHDLAGVRITTYVELERQYVVGKLGERFAGPGGSGDIEVDVKDNTAGEKFYRATHCQVSLRSGDLHEEDEALRGASCEIQICSMLAHVWNEIEHDLAYKPLTGELSSGERDILTSLGQMLTAGDTLINLLLTANEQRLLSLTGVFTDQFDFVARMRGRFPEAMHFPLHAPELLAELRRQDLDTPANIESELLVDDHEARAGELLAALRDQLDYQGERTHGVDPESSDRLLVLLLEQRVDRILARLDEDGGPAGARLETLALAFRAMKGRDQS